MKKVAVVTGTSKGLGKEIALMLLKQNWTVYGISRTESNIDSEDYIHLISNITDCKDLELIPKVDLLVNNAAVFEMLPFEETTHDSIDRIIDVNVKGTIHITKHTLNNMVSGSKIIFINSVAGLEELENQSLYCASKYALTGFAGVLGKELQKRKIKVVSIHPGGINTTLWNKDNPYPCGESSDALSTKDVTSLIDFICHSSPNVEYKTIKLFPDVEWHN
jgi:3-oxoacyl-[acyl-carrier protein] reductase